MSVTFRFPFRWGSTPDVVIPTPPPPPLWTNIRGAAQNWHAQGAVLRRFEHIYPEADTGPGWEKVTDVVE